MTILRNPKTISRETRASAKLLELHSHGETYTPAEKQLVIDHVNRGGSLLTVIDEECRTPLVENGINTLLEPFGMSYSADTDYLHNCGALAKGGLINLADREIPYSGGRSITGGTPFFWRIDQEGQLREAHAAYHITEGGGKIVALAEAMVYMLMGTPHGVRLSGVYRDPSQTTYWGKDSHVFMDEVRQWLLNSHAFGTFGTK